MVLDVILSGITTMGVATSLTDVNADEGLRENIATKNKETSMFAQVELFMPHLELCSRPTILKTIQIDNAAHSRFDQRTMKNLLQLIQNHFIWREDHADMIIYQLPEYGAKCVGTSTVFHT